MDHHHHHRHHNHHHHLNSYNFDGNDVESQQKEIDVALASAFENISCDSLFDDDIKYVQQHVHHRYSENDGSSSRHSVSGSSELSTSTPIHRRKKYDKNGLFINYNNDTDDLYAKADALSVYKTSHDIHGNKSRLSDENRNLYLENDYNKDTISSSLLLENDKLSKDLSRLNEKCSKICLNYQVLQDKFNQLHKVNETNLSVIDRLQSNVKLLELRLKEEKQAKKIIEDNNVILKSTVDSLNYQLNENNNNDFITKQERLIANLKHKHDQEVTKLREQVENLQQIIQNKDEEICAKNLLIEHLKEQNNVQDKHNIELKLCQVVKDEKSKHNTMVAKLKQDWCCKLDEDVCKISRWLEECASNQNSTSLPVVELDPIKRLCTQLSNLNLNKEGRIKKLMTEFKEVIELKETLLESKLSTSNISNHSDKSQILDEVRTQLDELTQRNDSLVLKLSKYKHFYQALVKRHQQEIQELKNEFRSKLESYPHSQCNSTKRLS